MPWSIRRCVYCLWTRFHLWPIQQTSTIKRLESSTPLCSTECCVCEINLLPFIGSINNLANIFQPAHLLWSYLSNRKCDSPFLPSLREALALKTLKSHCIEGRHTNRSGEAGSARELLAKICIRNGDLRVLWGKSPS